MSRLSHTCLAILALLPLACSSNAGPASSGVPPTVAPIFERFVPTEMPDRALDTPDTPETAAPQQTAVPRAQIVEMPIYDEALQPGWSLEESHGISYDVQSTARALSSTRAISFTPQIDDGMLYFTVLRQPPQAILNEKLVGLSLWLNGGDMEIGTQDLAVTILGSNAHSYSVPNDTSVVVDDKVYFSETRLALLGFHHAIPANTWAEVLVYLDELPYDPDYKYVTGVYIKNDKGFRQTVHVDHVALLMVK
jgi:hypothetical protein